MTAFVAPALATVRRGQQALINVNPSRVTIERTTVEEVDGGPQETKVTLGPYTVRVFLEGPAEGEDKTNQTPGATYITQFGYSMAADYLADLRHDSRTQDEFVLGGYGRFRIMAVYPLKMHGEVWGYQCGLSLVT